MATVSINAFLYDLNAANGTYLGLWYMNKDPELCATYARHITKVQDLDVNVYKHIKMLYMVGDYGDNTITPSWTKYSDYSNWMTLETKQQDQTTYGDVPVWRNLGQTRRCAFQVDWSGPSNITHEAIEVLYNIHTQ